jgi:hypothetical protein
LAQSSAQSQTIGQTKFGESVTAQVASRARADALVWQ